MARTIFFAIKQLTMKHKQLVKCDAITLSPSCLNTGSVMWQGHGHELYSHALDMQLSSCVHNPDLPTAV
jgi:hypothetical protein